MQAEVVLDLFDQYLAAKAEYEAAKEAEGYLKKQSAPTVKHQYDSFDDFDQDWEARRRHDEAIKRLEEATKEAAQKMEGIAKNLIPKLPRQIWFRHGNVGIGVAVTNWGGYRVYLCVAPWQDEMPSLDHNHRGD
ncbi:MAG: hypothetical protein ACUVX1_14430 [Chloroflexota bacterium]